MANMGLSLNTQVAPAGSEFGVNTAVVVPSTPSDAYWLLRQAIVSRDPVIYLEPKRRYWVREAVDTSAPALPIGRAAVRRIGADGIIRSLAGNGSPGFGGDGGVATSAKLRSPRDVVVRESDGSVFVAVSLSSGSPAVLLTSRSAAAPSPPRRRRPPAAPRRWAGSSPTARPWPSSSA